MAFQRAISIKHFLEIFTQGRHDFFFYEFLILLAEVFIYLIFIQYLFIYLNKK